MKVVPFSAPMPSVRELSGRVVTLPVKRFGPPGAFLSLGPSDQEVILLPGAEVPEGTEVGDELDVFVHFDSEDRPIATSKRPKLGLGQVAFLEVTSQTRIGAFVDWGLPKELLVPHAEQTADMTVGKRYAIGLYVDPSGRLAGTMRVAEMLRERRGFEVGEWVRGEAWRKEDGIGVFVIVERRYVGLLPESEPHDLGRGDACEARVANVLPDGKIELSLRALAHEEIDGDAERILAELVRDPSLAIGDHTSPDEVRRLFGISKKAYKRALGRLLRERRVEMDASGDVHPSKPARTLDGPSTKPMRAEASNRPRRGPK